MFAIGCGNAGSESFVRSIDSAGGVHWDKLSKAMKFDKITEAAEVIFMAGPAEYNQAWKSMFRIVKLKKVVVPEYMVEEI